MYLHTAELYPTTMRATAVGSCSTIGRVGSILAPVLAGLKPNSLAFIIMGGSALIGGLLVFLLPETLGSLLPESIDDIANIGKGGKRWYQWLPRSQLKEINSQTTNSRRRAQESEEGRVEEETKVKPVEVKPKFLVPEIVVQAATPAAQRAPMAPVDTEDEDDRHSSDEEGGDGSGGEVSHAMKQQEAPVEVSVVIETPSGAAKEDVMSQQSDRRPSLSSIPEEREIVIVVPSSASVEDEMKALEALDIVINDADCVDSGMPDALPVAGGPLSQASEQGASATAPVPVQPVTPMATSLAVGSSGSRRISTVAPASIDHPEAKKIGKLWVIPTGPSPSEIPQLPEATEIPELEVIPEQSKGEELVVGSASLGLGQPEKSRRFSRLPPARIDSEKAVKMGSKFTMIPTEE